MLVSCISVNAQVAREDSKKIDTLEVKKQPYTLEQVAQAIIQVESGGNPKAYNPVGNCAGIMQITPSCVKQCNIWLKNAKSKKRYTLQDRFNKTKSLEMFYMVQSHYNKGGDVERSIRVWNGGPGFTRRGTQKYYEKVMKKLKSS